MLVNKEAISGGRFRVLSEEQLDMIHLSSLEILERTGMIVHDQEAIELFQRAGAYVSGNRVRIPADLVEKAIASAPSKITFCGAKGDRAMQLYRNNVYYGLGTDLPAFIDPYKGNIRQTVLKDIENVGKIAQEAEGISFVASQGLASDVPQELVDLHHLFTLRKYCSKPNWVTATDYGNMKALIDMAAISAGGYEALRRSPSIGLYAEPVSPLTCSKEATQKLLLCAEYGIPVTWASGVMAGATGSATLAGTIALGNAEGLGGLVMHQLKKSGAPFIFGIVGSTMDMKTAVSCYGGPELPMIHTIVGELGRYYNIPSYGTGGCTDSNTLDVQAGMEAMFSNMMAALGGTNLVHDNGYLGSGLIGSLESILICSEIAGFIGRMQKGIEINDETLSVDLIDEVGPGGEYVTKKHTTQHYKKETWYPDFLNRKQYQVWEATGKKSMTDNIQEKVKAIIEKDIQSILDAEEISEYEKIIEKRAKEISEGKFHREDF